MIAIALSLAASSCWGVSDFVGGLKSRRLPVLSVLLVVECAGLVLVASTVLATGADPPSARVALVAAGAGCAGVVALGAFYRALAIGTMSIVAPISATGVAIPVAVGVLTGDRPSAAQGVGLVVATAGIVLASREQTDAGSAARRASRASLGLALVAAAGFGAYFVGADYAADDGVLWTLLLARAAAAPVIVAVALARRTPMPGRLDVAQLAVAGSLDLLATGLYALATTKGLLAIVAVVGALYPVATVVLARGFLGERIARVQGFGIATALGGVALLAAG